MNMYYVIIVDMDPWNMWGGMQLMQENYKTMDQKQWYTVHFLFLY